MGETKRRFDIRYKEHLKDIQFKRDKPIPNHVLSHGNVETKIVPQILVMIKGNPELEKTTTFRRIRETHWINTLKTLAPAGLNTLG